MSKLPEYIVSHRTLLNEAEELELFRVWQASGAKHLQDYIVRCYSPIVLKFAKRFAGYGIDQEDLTSEGMLALVEAARRFEIKRGFRFATFARMWVEGLMLAYIAKNYFTMNVCSGSRMKKLFFNLRRVLNQEYRSGSPEGDPTFFNRVAEKMEVDVEDVEAMYALFARPAESLSEPIGGDGEDDDYTRGDLLEDPNATPDEVVMDTMMSEYHKRVVRETVRKVLTRREAKVFMAQVVADDNSQRTLQNLADELGLSKERIRQIREVAYAKVENALLDGTTTTAVKAMFKN